MKRLSVILSAAAFSLLAGAEYCAPVQKKIINTGWNTSFNTKILKERIAEIEAATPCQGTSFRVETRNRAGKKLISTYSLCGRDRWEYENWEEALWDVQETKFRKFTDNFLGTAIRPGDVDWFSDSDWETVCHNYGLAARFAKEAKLKGIVLDLEEYGAQLWDPFREKKHSRAELYAKVRQRGAEFGKAIFTNFPDIKILAYFWFSLTRKYYLDPTEAHSLIAPFVNGIYDSMPPTATVLEGHEAHGYTARNYEQIYGLRVDFRDVFQRFLDPRHKSKFFLQTQLAVPFYMDAYFCREGKMSLWQKALSPDIEQVGQLELYKRNLRAALRTSDEYVWFWSERVTWYPMDFHSKNYIMLEKKFPGITAWTELMQDPAAYAKRPGALGPNLLGNGDFAKFSNGSFPHWSTWQDAKAGKGQFLHSAQGGYQGRNAAVLAGVGGGCFVQNIPAKPGQMFLVSGWAKTEGSARASLGINWKDAKDAWCWRGYAESRMFPAQNGKWQFVSMIVMAPELAEKLTVMPSSSTGDRQSKVSFSQLEVRELHPVKK